MYQRSVEFLTNKNSLLTVRIKHTVSQNRNIKAHFKIKHTRSKTCKSVLFRESSLTECYFYFNFTRRTNQRFAKQIQIRIVLIKLVMDVTSTRRWHNRFAGVFYSSTLKGMQWRRGVCVRPCVQYVPCLSVWSCSAESWASPPPPELCSDGPLWCCAQPLLACGISSNPLLPAQSETVGVTFSCLHLGKQEPQSFSHAARPCSKLKLATGELRIFAQPHSPKPCASRSGFAGCLSFSAAWLDLLQFP